jgi:hypothetical protein
MEYFPQSLVLKNEETCGGDGDICANEEIDSDDSGSDAARRTEQVCVHRYIILIWRLLQTATV